MTRERHGRRTLRHIVCNDTASLVYLANQDAITIHAWLSRAPALERPDRMVFDLDPPGKDFDAVCTAARRVRDLMHELGLVPFVMTTGSRGLHVVAPLVRRAGFDAVRALARDMARELVRRHPDSLTMEQRLAKRRGRLYLDTGRNAWGQTAVAPYAVRALPGAPVATPLSWNELGRLPRGARMYGIDNLARRLARTGDPWRDIAEHAAGPASARRALDRVLRRAGPGSPRGIGRSRP